MTLTVTVKINEKSTWSENSWCIPSSGVSGDNSSPSVDESGSRTNFLAVVKAVVVVVMVSVVVVLLLVLVMIFLVVVLVEVVTVVTVSVGSINGNSNLIGDGIKDNGSGNGNGNCSGSSDGNCGSSGRSSRNSRSSCCNGSGISNHGGIIIGGGVCNSNGCDSRGGVSVGSGSRSEIRLVFSDGLFVKLPYKKYFVQVDTNQNTTGNSFSIFLFVGCIWVF